jgi:hypothetical protein
MGIPGCTCFKGDNSTCGIHRPCEVVHCLREGLALCGQPGIPASWPPGHRWVALDAWPKEEGEERDSILASLCATCDTFATLGPLPDAQPRIDAEEERQRLLRNAPNYRQGLERLKQRALRVQDLVKAGDPTSRDDALHVLRSMVELADYYLKDKP